MIGVLALQGGVAEHINALQRCKAEAVEVRTKHELEKIDALIIPGGESTTLFKLMKREGLDITIKRRAGKGMPVFGTCAGLILLSKEIVNNGKGFGLMDISVRRNDYGRQVDSFEEEIKIKGFSKSFNAVFIRAPVVSSYGNGVEVLAKQNGNPVLLRQKNILAASFHPELTDDTRIHELFLKIG